MSCRFTVTVYRFLRVPLISEMEGFFYEMDEMGIFFFFFFFFYEMEPHKIFITNLYVIASFSFLFFLFFH